MFSNDLFKMVSGILSIIFSVILLCTQPIDQWRKTFLILSENGIIFNIWQNPTSVNTLLKFYAFNITNKDAFLEGREKLKLVEVGPYIFRESVQHLNTTFDHTKGILSTNPRYKITWDPQLNDRQDDEKLIVPNIIMLVAATKVAKEHPLLKTPLNVLYRFTNSEPIIEQTFKEFAFNSENLILEYIHAILPNWIDFDKIGILDRMYNCEGDKMSVNTGEINANLSGLIESYNEMTELPYWPTSSCNLLNGATDAIKSGNNLHPNQTIYLYRKMLCRALPFVPADFTIRTDFGMPVTLYKLKQNKNRSDHDETSNKCYCKDEYCLPDGLYDITHCFYGFSVALSNPHFHNNDPMLLNNVDGLEPREENHNSYLILNPETGVTMKASIKLQVNIVLSNTEGIYKCDIFSNMVLPLGWLEILLPKLPLYIRILLYMLNDGLKIIETVLAYSLLLIGIILVIIAGKTKVQNRRRRILFNKIPPNIELEYIFSASEYNKSNVHIYTRRSRSILRMLEV